MAHNGVDQHTVRGNLNWMKAREAILESDLFTKAEIDMLLPILSGRKLGFFLTSIWS
ncbi:hypothetical protein P4S72_24445 [Vibrio sp. PP-XX7]